MTTHQFRTSRVRSQGNLPVSRQLFLPVEINGALVPAHLDTGAQVSAIPYDMAVDVGIDPRPMDVEGRYTYVGGLTVPYGITQMDVGILPPNDQLALQWTQIEEGKREVIDFYDERPEPVLDLTDITFKVDMRSVESLTKELTGQLEEQKRLNERSPDWFVFLGVLDVFEQLEVHIPNFEYFYLSKQTRTPFD